VSSFLTSVFYTIAACVLKFSLTTGKTSEEGDCLSREFSVVV
jgi:hypothetical protein